MTELYTEGTIAVENGSVDFVGTGTAWLPVNAKKGDPLNVAGHVMLIGDITDPTHGKFATPYPGATASGLPYAVVKTSAEWGTNRTLALQTAEMIQLLTTVEVPNTGVRFDALGTFANRVAHDAKPAGYVYLSVDGDGVTGVWTLYTKLSATSGDWSTGQQLEGREGRQGNPGLIGDWRNAWAPGTYNELDAVQHNGSSYIVKVGVSSTTQEPPGSDWELVAAKGAQGTSAYEVAVAEGFVGDEAAWLASLAGADGLGVPPGGTTGQALKKASDADNDTVWADDEGGGTAADVSFTPTGNIAAVTVQAAIEELDAEKAAVTAIREKLTADRTYYVRGDGNDGNNGLPNTAGGAFKTLQKAWDTICTLDLNTFTATIQIADGTYSAGITTSISPVGGLVNIQGNAASPASVVVSSSVAGGVFNFTGPQTCVVLIKDLKPTSSTSKVNGINLTAFGKIQFSNIDFGALTGSDCYHIQSASPGALIVAVGAYRITGSATCHIVCSDGGAFNADNRAVTLTGTPAFSIFILLVRGGVAVTRVMAFSGSATGKKFEVSTGGGVETGGGGANYFPGTASTGTTTAPGWYA